MLRETLLDVAGERVQTKGRLKAAPTKSRTRLFAFGGWRQLFDRIVAGVLLDDRQQPRVEEADLEEHEERHGAEDAVGERVEHRGREVEAERQLDDRLHDEVLPVLLAD